MNRSRMFLLAAVAFLVAIGVAAFTYQVLNNRLKPVDDTTQIVVAALPVSLGAKLTDADVRLASWPKGSVPDGSFRNISEVIGRGVLYPIAPNEVLLPNKLAQEGSGAGLMSTIPEGFRAVSVKVNDVIGVAGFTVPGTRVDVVVTIRDRDNSMSRAVLNNIQVLAAGTKFDQDQAKNGQPIKTAVVTLLVTPPDAEKLALAQNEGQIVLALRNPLDTESVQTQGARMSGLLGAPAPPPVIKASGPTRKAVTPPPPPPAPKPYTVDAIRGAKRSEEIIKSETEKPKGGGL